MNVFPAEYSTFIGTNSLSATTSTAGAGASMDPIFSVVSAVVEPIGNVIDDLSYTPQEQAEAAAAATQAAANLAAAQSGASTAAASEATKQQAIKYAFAAALVLAAVWAFSRRR